MNNKHFTCFSRFVRGAIVLEKGKSIFKKGRNAAPSKIPSSTVFYSTQRILHASGKTHDAQASDSTTKKRREMCQMPVILYVDTPRGSGGPSHRDCHFRNSSWLTYPQTYPQTYPYRLNFLN